MKWIIVGLGNPGGEYAKTRHNAGRIVLDEFHAISALSEWKFMKTYNALASAGEINDTQLLLLQPETYMNESGRSLITLVKSAPQAAQLIVIYDDIDLPLGTWKISWNRNSGGHNGVESIIARLKTKEFIRIRVGIAPTRDDGTIKKPKGEEAVIKFVLGKFRESELVVLKKISREIASALPTVFTEKRDIVMNRFN